jgi:hypothetical protein
VEESERAGPNRSEAVEDEIAFETDQLADSDADMADSDADMADSDSEMCEPADDEVFETGEVPSSPEAEPPERQNRDQRDRSYGEDD